MIRCKCGVITDYGLTCTRCSLIIISKEDQDTEETPPQEEYTDEED